MSPRFSVVVLNYNYGRYLPAAVESALAQDVGPAAMEVLVVDDGSTDDSAERIKPYLDRVRWLTKPNGGQVSAFNFGFKEARGELVALLESDDLWAPDKLRRCAAALDAEPSAAAVQHWLLQVDGDLKPLPGYTYPAGLTRFTLTDALRGLPLAGTSALVFRADALRPDLPLPETLYGADICLRSLAAAMGPLLNVPEVLGRRRIHGANLFGASIYDDPRKLEDGLAVHGVLTKFHEDLFAKRKLPPNPEFFHRLRMEKLQMQFFSCRYQGRFGEAWSTWRELSRAGGARGYSFFKGATMLIALASPGLYWGLHRAYERAPWLRRARRAVLPFGPIDQKGAP